MIQLELLSWSCCHLTETQRWVQCIFVELGGGLRKPCKELMLELGCCAGTGLWVSRTSHRVPEGRKEGRTEKRREGRKEGLKEGKIKGGKGRGREGRSKGRKEGGRDGKKEERKERRQARRKVSLSHFCTETFSWLL